jgi:DNA mismatch repair protein MutL
MTYARPNLSAPRPVIRQLDPATISRIAAGEVVERPAAAVKELVENALDAGATRIEVAIADGGRSLIRVTDDGCGMTAADLPLALSRHATSKTDGADLLNIRSFGFRGEALPALGAVGRLTITSRAAGAEAAQITVTGGDEGPIRPAAQNRGTTVDLRDLFYATPARLKFLKSDRAEAMAVADTLRRLAMAEPGVAFTLRDLSEGEDRVTLRFPAETGEGALARRLSAVLGRDFAQNAIPVAAEREGVRLAGYAALPTYSRGAAVAQHLFVNGRPVRDKLLIGALKAAYGDLLPRDRHPAVALYLTLDPQEVDVNVHPAKAEVRFRDPGLVRGLVITALRHALAEQGHRTSGTLSAGVLGALAPASPHWPPARPAPQILHQSAAWQAPAAPGLGEARKDWAPAAPAAPAASDPQTATDYPLGTARAHLFGTYILAQTATGLVLVDAHAAAERLAYERLKARAADGVPAQALLIPEIVTLDPAEAHRLTEAAPDLARLGLEIDPFGPGAVAVRATPAPLGEVDAPALVRDVADALAEGTGDALADRLDRLASRIACHGSIRSGRALRPDEMNALLREMEANPFSGQCNHGRPTYVELRRTDLDRLFGR